MFHSLVFVRFCNQFVEVYCKLVEVYRCLDNREFSLSLYSANTANSSVSLF